MQERLSYNIRLSEEFASGLNDYYKECVLRDFLKVGIYGYNKHTVKQFVEKLRSNFSGMENLLISEGTANKALLKISNKFDMQKHHGFLPEDLKKQFLETVKSIDEDFVVHLETSRTRQEFVFLFKSAIRRILKGATYPPVFFHIEEEKFSQNIDTLVKALEHHLSLLERLRLEDPLENLNHPGF